MSQCKDDVKKLFATFSELRNARVQFVCENRKFVANFIKHAAAQRDNFRKRSASLSLQRSRERYRFREKSRRNVAQTLTRNRSERHWGGLRLQRQLALCSREIRWSVSRLLRTSASDRMRSERERVREASQTIKSVKRSVQQIRSSVNQYKKMQVTSSRRRGILQ